VTQRTVVELIRIRKPPILNYISKMPPRTHLSLFILIKPNLLKVFPKMKNAEVKKGK
jgi:hypothetical protein